MLADKLIKYVPVNEQEQKDIETMLEFIEKNPDYLERSNIHGHFTVSSWIVNKDINKVLFCYHKIHDSWCWVGGHADGEEDLLSVALREATEETGITPTGYKEDILSVEILPMAGHEKNGKYVSSHVHFNVTFLIFADENEKTTSNPSENLGVKWVDFSDIEKVSNEKWIVERIYKKIIKSCL